MTLAARLGHHGPFLDFEAEIPEGTIAVLLGPSGSGKTSTLRAIAGLLTPTSGRIALDSQVWFDADRRIHIPTRRRQVGWVPQNCALFPHLTALGNVESAMLDRTRHARATAGRNLLQQLHVGGLELRYPHQLSGGQQQRVAVARALAREPRVLLLDEPFSAVDRGTRRQLQVELRRLHEVIGTTILLVTHDLEEARLLADHVILLHHGRVLQAGPISDVERAPASVAAAQLLDIQNIRPGTFDPLDGEPGLRWGPYHLACRPPSRHIEPTQPLSWCIGAGQIVLHRADRPSRWGSDNPIDCIIEEILELGDDAQVSLRPKSLHGEPLLMKISEHLVERNRLTVGDAVRVSLVAGAIQPLLA